MNTHNFYFGTPEKGGRSFNLKTTFDNGTVTQALSISVDESSTTLSDFGYLLNPRMLRLLACQLEEKENVEEKENEIHQEKKEMCIRDAAAKLHENLNEPNTYGNVSIGIQDDNAGNQELVIYEHKKNVVRTFPSFWHGFKVTKKYIGKIVPANS